MNTLLCLAAAMALGLLLTRLAKKVNLPNVTAYLLAGLAVGPYCLNLFHEGTLAGVAQITSVALGFIAFSIGGEFKRESLKRVGAKTFIRVGSCGARRDGINIGEPVIVNAAAAFAYARRNCYCNCTGSHVDGRAAIPRAGHDDEHAAFRRCNG